MANALMATAAKPIGQTEMEVRTTLEPLREDTSSSEQHDAPEFNEVETDDSGELTGLAPRVAGSDTTPVEKFPAWWAEAASVNHNALVDNQVASSGVTAKREATANQGHGRMQYAIGIEPEIRDGAQFGNDYFVRDARDIQEGAGEYMAPTPDHWANIVAARNAQRQSRNAALSSEIRALL